MVLPEGCAAEGDPTDCADRRGLLFATNGSTSFDRVGDEYFELPYYEPERDLGYTGNSLVGRDIAILGWDGSTAPLLQDQIITGFAAKQPFLGVLGLTPRPVNITSFVDQRPSPLGTLLADEKVKSSYWAYSAGARYRQPETHASLTFGGYDALRGNVKHVLTAPTGIETGRDLQLAIRSIAIDDDAGRHSAAGLPMYTIIDSTIPEIWLPIDACAAFEHAFGLTWNETVSMYLVNDTHHDTLTAQNASITFTVSDSTDASTSSLNITFPYAAFDMEASFPLAGITDNSSLRYFPLKQAQNESQYVLGRTFLQEAYLAVDYDKSQFHLSKATFPSDAATTDIIVAGSEEESGLSTGAIVGVVIGAVAAVAFMIAFGWWFRRRRRAAKRWSQPTEDKVDGYEHLQQDDEHLSQLPSPELEAGSVVHTKAHPSSQELDGQIANRLKADRSDLKTQELDGEMMVHEAPSGKQDTAEVQGSPMVHEAPVRERPAELWTPPLTEAKNTSDLAELP